MAGDVIDLISSSPTLSIISHPDPPFSKQPHEAGNRSKRTASPQTDRSHAQAGSSWHSIDLCLSDDLTELPELEARDPKRQRVSKSPPRQGVSASRSSHQPITRPYQPPLRGAASEKTHRPVVEAIEFTSSLDLDAPDSHNHAPVQPFVTGVRPPRISRDPDCPSQCPDPFASSPLPHRALADLTDNFDPKPAIDNFLDPFVSSPAVASRHSRTPNPKPRDPEFSDPFASSPVAAPAKQKEQRGIPLDTQNYGKNRNCKEWDPISSSAPEQTPRRLPSHFYRPDAISIDSDSDSQEASGDDDEFPDIANFDASKFEPRRRTPLQRSQSDNLSTKQARTNPAPKKSVEQRALEREANSAAKAAEKERKRMEKEQAKAERLKEKERAAAMAEVNKLRTDKKVSTPEMIVMMPSSIDAGLRVQIETFLDGLSVQFINWDSPVGNAFKWRRKVTSRFDEEMGRWEPIPLQIQSEKHALIILTADELVDLALNDNLDSSIQQTKEHFSDHEVVYILQGMNSWMRKNRNIRNRQFASVVRQGADAAATQSRRRNRPAEEHISEGIIEDSLLRLQVEHEVLAHNTENQFETAQWVVRFTQHVSTIPYKKQRDDATSAAGFCMESGQVRTGEDAHDVYVRMLQEIVRVTAPIAHGIAAEFDNVGKLVQGLERGGPTRLEGLRKSANRDGALSDRTIGQAVSRRIYKVFTGRDESSTDV